MLANCSATASNITSAIVQVRANASFASGTILKKYHSGIVILGISEHMLTASTDVVCIRFHNSSQAVTGQIVSSPLDELDMRLVATKPPEDASVYVPTPSADYGNGDQIVSIGFKDSGILIEAKGQIQMVLDRKLEGGYSIGTSSDVEKGMSGGGVFNSNSQLIGIISTHANPLWESNIYYLDKKIVGKELSDRVAELSMNIDAKTALALADKTVGSLPPLRHIGRSCRL